MNTRINWGGSTVVAALTTVLMTVTAQAQISSTYQIDAAHDGTLVTQKEFAPPLKKLWSVDLGGPISYPIVAQKMVIVTVSNIGNDYGSQMFALSATTGKIIWQKAIAGTYFSSYAAYDKGLAFVVNFDGILQAFDAANGAEKWTEQLPRQYVFNSAPASNGHALFIAGSGEGSTVYRIDEATGAVVWENNVNAAAALAIAGHRLYTDNECDLYDLNIVSGAVLWHDNANCSGGLTGDVAVHGGSVFEQYYGGEGGVIASARTGQLQGTFISNDAAFSSSLMFQAQQGKLVATEFSSGNIAWTFAPTDTIDLPPIVVNKTVYALSTAGNLYAVAAKTGHVQQTLTPGVGKNQSEGASVTPGLGAGQGILVVPSVSLLTAYGP
jgi:outer membrane protein assembly factor BamB